MSQGLTALGAAEIALLESAMAESPTSRLFLRLGQAYIQAGRLDQARQTLERNLFLQPEEVAGHQLLSQVLHAQGDTGQALAQLQRAAVIISRQAGLYQDLAEILAGQGRAEKAQLAQRLARDLGGAGAEPSSEEAPVSQDTPTMAEIYAGQGLHDQAAVIYRRLLAADPGNQVLAQRLDQLQAPPAPTAGLLESLEALQEAALARASNRPISQGDQGLLAGLTALQQAAQARASAEDGGQRVLLERLKVLKRANLARAAAGASGPRR
ncbi:Tetratricopeptide repeat protein [Desulfarculales bacterium]